jgi:hypothetical protein
MSILVSQEVLLVIEKASNAPLKNSQIVELVLVSPSTASVRVTQQTELVVVSNNPNTNTQPDVFIT